MDFSQALNALKQGKKVARAGWNGKGMFIFLVQGSTFQVSRPPLLGIYPAGTKIVYEGHIDMKMADGHIMAWTATNVDLLGDDWFEVAV